jgi:hypothetical protein
MRAELDQIAQQAKVVAVRGRFRVLYSVQRQTVLVLRVILKTFTTAESV